MLDHRIKLMCNMCKFIIAVQLDLRTKIAAGNMTCPIQNRIDRPLDAAKEQDEGNNRQDNNNHERNQCRRLNP